MIVNGALVKIKSIEPDDQWYRGQERSTSLNLGISNGSVVRLSGSPCGGICCWTVKSQHGWIRDMKDFHLVELSHLELLALEYND